jgi:hypothetical protein
LKKYGFSWTEPEFNNNLSDVEEYNESNLKRVNGQFVTFGMLYFRDDKGLSVHIAKEAKNETVQMVPHTIGVDYGRSFVGRIVLICR